MGRTDHQRAPCMRGIPENSVVLACTTSPVPGLEQEALIEK